MISIMLLGISNCCTDSLPLLLMNKLGIFLLSFILILHTIYYDAEWNLPKYLGAILRTMGRTVTCLICPLIDLASFYDAQKQKKSQKKDYFIYYHWNFFFHSVTHYDDIPVMQRRRCIQQHDK